MQSREKCYKCMRPATSCMCKYTKPIHTNTRFIILMHPMEDRKVKNGSGRLTHLQLNNSEIITGIDFTKNIRVNKLLADKDAKSFILYPGDDSTNLSSANTNLPSRMNIFLLDATWPCAKKMIKLSSNLHCIPFISFENTSKSNFRIKQQPAPLCLSTIESTLKVIELLNDRGVENCDTNAFLKPFEKMVEYQIECIENPHIKSYRSDTRGSVEIKDKYRVNAMRSLFFESKNFD